MPTTATRPKQAAAPIGKGHLHQALEDSCAVHKLKDFCAAIDCTVAEASADGIHLDALRVADLMRQRGYHVSAPAKASLQPLPGHTGWRLAITLPNNGPTLRLGFVTPDSS